MKEKLLRLAALAQRHNTQAVTGFALLASMAGANAAFTVPTEITEAAVSVGLVGAAVFAIYVAIKLYKWIKAAL
jgi:hypothetical protein